MYLNYLATIVVSLLIYFLLSSCTKRIYGEGRIQSIVNEERFIIIDKRILVTDELVFDKEVIMYPGAFFETKDMGKVVFKKPFTVFGAYQVFDNKVNIAFDEGVVSILNPLWFGAIGYDEGDDTESFVKLFEVVSSLSNALRIEIPIGKYIISSQMVIESLHPEKAVIHLQGVSNSNTGYSGSSFIWNGAQDVSMFKMKNVGNSVFENLDFNAKSGKYPKHNIEMRPYMNQIVFQKCSFGGCAGNGSANINLNEGNGQQVSEITFSNCSFRGVVSTGKITSHAVIGGWANTKDFYFLNCTFGPYAKEALKLTTTDILLVEGCTFFENDVDICCMTCKSNLISNYSEGSSAFWMSSASSNFNSTTMINNQFTGIPKDGFVIRDGSGTLVLINNNFGGGNYNDDENRVRWQENEYNMIYSVGNVFKNSDVTKPAFYNRSNNPYNVKYIESIGDLGGVLGEGRERLGIIRKE